MATITPIFTTVQETLTGTSNDDLFIINSGIIADKFLFGGAGYDTVSLPYTVNEYLKAVFYPGSGHQNAVLTKANSQFSLYDNFAIFTDGIEAIEFTDQTRRVPETCPIRTARSDMERIYL